ncbi:MAG: AEC family transporter, partial [Desulfopila sp.]|nr:AEC family transporter [Desulfopila sp.]
LGFLLKRIGLTNTVFLQTSDKLVYYIFFPLMLFWKIGGASYEDGIAWNLVFASFSALAVMFLLSILLIAVCRISDFQAGSFAQSCYRFNTYIGVAVVLNSFGEDGIKYFGIVIGLAIPVINAAAVTTLIWFSQEKVSSLKRSRLLFKALVSNPLILGCLAGLAYSRGFTGFPQFLDNSLGLISMLTLPLALLSIGGSLTFKGIHHHARLSLLAALAKLVVFPLVGYGFLKLFGVQGTPFLVGMIFFSLPTSTAIYVLSSQMQSDTELASSAILFSTLLSFPVLTVVLLL